MSTIDKFRIKVSDKGYKEKPSAEEIKKITWGMKNNECKSVTFQELSKILSHGHSVLLADFKAVGDIKEDNINSLSCIALDIDSKEHSINMYEMISKINSTLGFYPIIFYCTFSDKNFTKFRLIYRLESPVDVQTYKFLYRAIQWKFEKYLDPATKNANRIWAGTNKNVFYNGHDIPIKFKDIVKLIKAHQSSIKRKAAKATTNIKQNNSKIEFTNDVYIKPEHKEEVMKYLIENIDLTDFIPKHLGGKFKKVGEKLTGSCAFHGGDNETALVIDKDRFTCFTHCGSGNVITAARKIYNIENFSEVAFKLLNEYGLSIPDSYIRRNNRCQQ